MYAAQVKLFLRHYNVEKGVTESVFNFLPFAPSRSDALKCFISVVGTRQDAPA